MLTGNVQKSPYVSKCDGIYDLEETKINEKSQWIQRNGQFAVWWDKDSSSWVIGDVSYLSSTVFIKGQSKNDNPPINITKWNCYSKEKKLFGRRKSNWIAVESNEIQFKDVTNIRGIILN